MNRTLWVGGWMVVVAVAGGCAEGECQDGTRPLRRALAGGVEEGCMARGDARGVVREGAWTVFHPDGRVKEVGTYVDGRRHGVFTRFHGNGLRAASGAYVHDREDGPWVLFDAHGLLEREETYRDGVLEGPFRRVHPNGADAEVGTFQQGARHGLWTWKTQGGVVLAEGAYVRARRDGPWVFRSPQGNVVERGGYVDGLREGRWETFRADGTRRAHQEMVEDVPHGESVAFHGNGQVAERGTMERGEKAGVWQRFHPNGQLAGEGRFVRGLEEGAWRFLDDAGRLVAEGRFERGVRRHLWRVHDADGNTALHVGEQTGFPQGVSPRGVMLARAHADGTVRVLLDGVVEPGSVFFVHQSVNRRVPATLVDIREGHAFPGAHPLYDDRVVGILKPEYPLVLGAQDQAGTVLLVTRDNLVGSPLERSVRLAEGPLPDALALQVDALADAALARTLRDLNRDARTQRGPGPLLRRTTEAARGRQRKGLSSLAESRQWLLGEERSVVNTHVVWRVDNKVVLGLGLELLVRQGRVEAWDVRRVAGPLAGTSVEDALAPEFPEALFDADNNGTPEELRILTLGGQTRITLHELSAHRARVYDAALLSEHFGL